MKFWVHVIVGHDLAMSSVRASDPWDTGRSFGATKPFFGPSKDVDAMYNYAYLLIVDYCILKLAAASPPPECLYPETVWYRDCLLGLTPPMCCTQQTCWGSMCGILGATSSESAPPTWPQLFCTYVCLSILSSFPHHLSSGFNNTSLVVSSYQYWSYILSRNYLKCISL